MANYIFQQIANQGLKEDMTPGLPESRQWFRDAASQVRQVNVVKEIKNTERLYNKLTDLDIGRLYMFMYDAKHYPMTLEYFDRFPLTFVVDRYKDGFLGMNLHYLPHVLRAKLMDRLFQIERLDSPRDSKKLRLTYNLLNNIAKFKYFRPCIKRYLTNQVRSRYLYVPYDDWDTALFLPTERFRGAKKTRVWSDSREIIRNL